MWEKTLRTEYQKLLSKKKITDLLVLNTFFDDFSKRFSQGVQILGSPVIVTNRRGQRKPIENKKKIKSRNLLTVPDDLILGINEDVNDLLAQRSEENRTRLFDITDDGYFLQFSTVFLLLALNLHKYDSKSYERCGIMYIFWEAGKDELDYDFIKKTGVKILQ